MYRLILVLFAALVVSAPVAAAESSEPQGCFYDEASGNFIAERPESDTQAFAGTLVRSSHLQGASVISVDGLRYEKVEDGRDSVASLNEHISFGGMVHDVRFFKPKIDPYNDYLFLPNNPRECTWALYLYRPVLHFAWMEEKSFGLEEFLFRHSGLAVDPASFRQEGGYISGIGFDVFSHPHKQEDGTQPRYNRTFIKADCKGKRLQMIDQRSYAANMELTSMSGGSDTWHPADDVYPALRTLMHVMCEVPRETWGEKTLLPGTLDEFSDYVHAAAHGKTK